MYQNLLILAALNCFETGVDDVYFQLRIARQQSQLAQGNKTYGHVGARIDTVSMWSVEFLRQILLQYFRF